MYLKFILIVATLCVVKASTIINVYDEPSDVRVQQVSDCNLVACEQQCRGIGFPGGACVNDRCKCDILTNAEDEPQSLQSDVNSEDPFSLRSCNNQECDRRCRRLKFPGGVCVNGRCKCDNFLRDTDFISHLEDSIVGPKCNYRCCNEQCQKRGFAGGVCVNNRCKCKNLRMKKELDVDEYPRSCIYNECQQHCRRMGYRRGVCRHGYCKCMNSRDNVEKSHSSIDDATETVEMPTGLNRVIRCNNQFNKFCDRLCHLLHFDSGTCLNSKCKCTKKEEFNAVANAVSNDIDDASNMILKEEENLENSSDDVLTKGESLTIPTTVRACVNSNCNNICRALGFNHGICSSSTVCRCYN